jgi:predicted house-cleaning noncanonical NTP pyrophosphatase (MazG superfamily)
MKIETQGYGSSMVATKYVYERINDIIANSEDEHRIKINTFMELHKSMLSELKELQEELAHNYQVDTKEKITD